MAINDKDFYASHGLDFDCKNMLDEYTKEIINQAKIEVLTELQLEIEEINHNEYCKNLNWCDSPMDRVQAMRLEEIEVKKIIQQKINSLKAEAEDTDGQNSN